MMRREKKKSWSTVIFVSARFFFCSNSLLREKKDREGCCYDFPSSALFKEKNRKKS